MSGFIRTWAAAPPLDIGLIRRNMELGGLRGSPETGPLILGDNLRLILADGQSTKLFDRRGYTEVKEEVSKGAFAADIVLELLGLILGIIGIEIPKSGQNALVGKSPVTLKTPHSVPHLQNYSRRQKWKLGVKIL